MWITFPLDHTRVAKLRGKSAQSKMRFWILLNTKYLRTNSKYLENSKSCQTTQSLGGRQIKCLILFNPLVFVIYGITGS